MGVKKIAPSISTEGAIKDKGDTKGVSKNIIAFIPYNSNKTKLLQNNLKLLKVI